MIREICPTVSNEFSQGLSDIPGNIAYIRLKIALFKEKLDPAGDTPFFLIQQHPAALMSKGIAAYLLKIFLRLDPVGVGWIPGPGRVQGKCIGKIDILLRFLSGWYS